MRTQLASRITCFAVWGALIAHVAIAMAEEPSRSKAGTLEVGAPIESEGVIEHRLRSSFQAEETRLQVLLPEPLPATPSVVYLLPVEPRDEHRYGDPIEEAKRRGLASRHGVIVVSMTFSALPWYADHPEDEKSQQEQYLLQVADWMAKRYVRSDDPQRHLLLGFSKSGWGAWTLMLRNPERFGRALAWDAPMMMQDHTKYGAKPIFGTLERFREYEVRSLLTASRWRKQPAAESPRLILTGYGNFRNEHVAMHELLVKSNTPHVYVDGPQRKHTWHTGWVAEGFELLLTRAAIQGKESPKPLKMPAVRK
ncbi:MAG: hypothetical protein KDB14_06910 [Planctomycetales bacterium]|nr:hypothetical protein [Planctomycetales bacterium]